MRTRKEAKDDQSLFELPIVISGAVCLASTTGLFIFASCPPIAVLTLILPSLLSGSSFTNFAETTIDVLVKTSLVSFGVFAVSYAGEKIAASSVGEKISDYVSHRQEEAIRDFVPHS